MTRRSSRRAALRLLLVTVGGVAAAQVAPAAGQPVVLESLELRQTAEGTAVELRASSDLLWSIAPIAPGQLLLELPGTSPGPGVDSRFFDDPLVHQVEVWTDIRQDRTETRIVLHIEPRSGHRVAQEGPRLTVQFTSPPAAADPAPASTPEPRAGQREARRSESRASAAEAAERARLERQSQELLSENSRLATELQRAAGRNAELVAELDAARAGLEGRNAAAQGRLTDLGEEKRQLEARLTNLRAELEGASGRNEELVAERDAARARIAEADGALAMGSSTFQVRPDVEPCMNLRRTDSRTAASVDCLAAGTEVTVLEVRGGWRRARLAGGAEGWAVAEFLEPSPVSRARIEQLEGELGEVRIRNAAARDALVAERDAARQQALALQQRLETRIADLTAELREADDQSADRSSLERQAQELIAENQRLATELRRAAVQDAELAAERDTARAALAAGDEAAQGRVTALGEEKRQLEARITDLRAELEGASGRNEELVAERDAARARIAEADGALAMGSSTFQVRLDVEPCMNLRQTDSRTAARVDCLAAGTEVTVLEVRGGWRRARLAGGAEGWAVAEFLEPSPVSRARIEQLEGELGEVRIRNAAARDALVAERDAARQQALALQQRLETRIADLTAELREADDQSADRSRLERQAQELIAENQRLATELRRAAVQDAELAAERDTARAALAAGDEAAQGRITALGEEKRQLEARITDLSAELEGAAGRNEELVAERDAARAGLAAGDEAAQGRITALDGEKRQLEARIADLSAELEGAAGRNAELVAERDTARAALAAGDEAAQGRITALGEEKRQLEARITDLSAELEGASGRNAELVAERDTARAALAAGDDAAQGRITALGEEKRQLEARIADLSAELEGAAGRNSELVEERDAMRARNAETYGALAMGSSTFQVRPDVDPCLNLRRTDSRTAARVDCLVAGTEVTVLEVRDGWRRARLAGGAEGWAMAEFLEPAPVSRARIEQLEGELEEQRTRHAAARDAVVAERDTARQELAALEAARTTETTQAEQASRAAELSRAELEEQRGRIAALDEEKRQLEARIAELATELEVAAGQNAELVAERDTARAGLAAGNDAAQGRITALDGDKQQLEARIADLSAELEGAAGRNAELVEERDAMRARNAETYGALAMGSSTFQVRPDVDPCLNLRRTDSRTAARVDCLAAGTEVTVLEVRDGWRRARLAGGAEGWAMAEFLEPAPVSRARIEQLEEELEEQRTRHAAARDAVVAERDTARQELAALEAARTTETTQAEQASRVAELSRAELEEQRGRVAALDEEKRQLEARIAELATELEVAAGQNAELAAERDVARAGLETASSAAESRIALLEEELAQQRDAARAARDSQTELGETQGRIASLGEEKRQLEARVADLTTALDEAAGRNAELVAERDAARIELADAAAAGRVAQLERQLAQRQAEDRMARSADAEPEPPPGPLEAPTPEPRAAPEIAVDPESLRRAVRAWASAWSDQRVDDYLACYATDFESRGGLSRAAWEARRRQRLTAPTVIEVLITDLEILSAEPRRARVRFEQVYRSNTFSDRVVKTLDLVPESNAWKIVAEVSEAP